MSWETIGFPRLCDVEFQCRLLGPVILTVIHKLSLCADESMFENKNKISVVSLHAALHSLITQQLNAVAHRSKAVNLCVNFRKTSLTM